MKALPTAQKNDGKSRPKMWLILVVVVCILMPSLVLNGWFALNQEPKMPYYGTLEGNVFEILAPLSGEVLALPVQIGEMIEKNQLIAQIGALTPQETTTQTESATSQAPTTKAPVQSAAPTLKSPTSTELARISREIKAQTALVQATKAKLTAAQARQKELENIRRESLLTLETAKKELESKRVQLQKVKDQIAAGTMPLIRQREAQQALKVAKDALDKALQDSKTLKSTTDAELEDLSAQISADNEILQEQASALLVLEGVYSELTRIARLEKSKPSASPLPTTPSTVIVPPTTKANKTPAASDPTKDISALGNVRASKSAWVESIHYQVGDAIAKGASIGSFVDPLRLSVVVYVDEPMLKSIALGDIVTLSVADDTTNTVPTTTGTVVRISQKAMSFPSTFFSWGTQDRLVIPVKIQVAPNPAFWPGMLLKASFDKGL